MKPTNEEADEAKDTLRASMDGKAIVNVGPSAREGKSRIPTKAADHDFDPEAKVTPVGIFLPASDELFLYGVTSKVTSDCLVDCLVDWWETVKERFPHIKTLLINLDNGPENHSRRTQFMQRLLEFVNHYHINIRLAYYPPYHSKYNPIERCWGILEQHWNGSLLDSIDAVIQFARTMSLQRETPSGQIGNDCLSDWGETDQEGHESGGNSPSAVALSGKVVRGYQVFSTCFPGYLIVLESLTAIQRAKFEHLVGTTIKHISPSHPY